MPKVAKEQRPKPSPRRGGRGKGGDEYQFHKISFYTTDFQSSSEFLETGKMARTTRNFLSIPQEVLMFHPIKAAPHLELRPPQVSSLVCFQLSSSLSSGLMAGLVRL